MNKKKLIDQWTKLKIITNKRVLSAFKKIKREDFVVKEFIKDAYEDVPLPILQHQTISQPTTVVIMLQALDVRLGMKILEIGAGSGYNAALLSILVGKNGKVYTTEIVPELAEFAKDNLKKFKNVEVHESDGSYGLPKLGKFDRIICTAAAKTIPKPLINQLKEGGIIVIPVGPKYGQKMIKGIKYKGKLDTDSLGNFMFVPLTGEFGK
ncbi:protein-L-isoaspartate(D-aspartate) O-methyltransferase [Candidatus Woesearchaeota archaeon]|nr:protein-L-isoaspartate(D-aspartate) O-methyltransferase [Candidatus Woesearchaeota archaeon]